MPKHFDSYSKAVFFFLGFLLHIWVENMFMLKKWLGLVTRALTRNGETLFWGTTEQQESLLWM